MTTKEYMTNKCNYFGLRYLGFWDNKHWGWKADATGCGGKQYEIKTNY